MAWQLPRATKRAFAQQGSCVSPFHARWGTIAAFFCLSTHIDQYLYVTISVVVLIGKIRRVLVTAAAGNSPEKKDNDDKHPTRYSYTHTTINPAVIDCCPSKEGKANGCRIISALVRNKMGSGGNLILVQILTLPQTPSAFLKTTFLRRTIHQISCPQ